MCTPSNRRSQTVCIHFLSLFKLGCNQPVRYMYLYSTSCYSPLAIHMNMHPYTFVFHSLVLPLTMIALLYLTASLVWAVSTLKEVEFECTRKFVVLRLLTAGAMLFILFNMVCIGPQWLLFTSSQLVIVQVFLVMVIYIHRKLNRVVTTRTWKLSQKAQLWG